jgi:hypothetical protein
LQRTQSYRDAVNEALTKALTMASAYLSAPNNGALCHDPALWRISASIIQRNVENAADKKKIPCMICLKSFVRPLF